MSAKAIKTFGSHKPQIKAQCFGVKLAKVFALRADLHRCCRSGWVTLLWAALPALSSCLYLNNRLFGGHLVGVLNFLLLKVSWSHTFDATFDWRFLLFNLCLFIWMTGGQQILSLEKKVWRKRISAFFFRLLTHCYEFGDVQVVNV